MLAFSPLRVRAPWMSNHQSHIHVDVYAIPQLLCLQHPKSHYKHPGSHVIIPTPPQLPRLWTAIYHTGLDVNESHPVRRMCFCQYLASSASLGRLEVFAHMYMYIYSIFTWSLVSLCTEARWQSGEGSSVNQEVPASSPETEGTCRRLPDFSKVYCIHVHVHVYYMYVDTYHYCVMPLPSLDLMHDLWPYQVKGHMWNEEKH